MGIRPEKTGPVDRHTLGGDQLAAHIVDCGCGVLLSRGAGEFSVRKVAQQARVSIGHLQHYFPTRDDLLCALVVRAEQDFYGYYRRHVAAIPDAQERIDACARFMLADSGRIGTLALLREFWSLASRNEAVAVAVEDFYTGLRRFGARLLKEANPALGAAAARKRACALIAMLSGAFLYTGNDDANVGFRQFLLAEVRALPFRAD